MNKLHTYITRWFFKKNMRSKLTLSFSMAFIAVFLLFITLLNQLIRNSYREKILTSADQSYEQAYSFFDSYIENMFFASELIYYNGDLQRIVGSKSYDAERDYGEQFREFLTLEKVFTTVENMESIYIARIFIPDNIFYSENQVHYAGISQLEAMGNYSGIMEKVGTTQIYFSAPEALSFPDTRKNNTLVSMFRQIKTTDGTNQAITVLQIGIEAALLQSVIDKSNITSSGLVYIINEHGQVICASSIGESLLEALLAEDAGSLPNYTDGASWRDAQFLGEAYIMNQKKLDRAGWTLIALLPEKEIDAQVMQITFIMVLLSLFAVIIIALVAYKISEYYTNRLQTLMVTMNQVRDGNLDVVLEAKEEDEIGIIFNNFNDMTGQLKNLMDRQFKMGKEVKAAQLRSLQAQINPHFLYNTLDLINWQAMDNGAAEITEIAQSLAKFYRISLSKGRQVISVAEELEHVKAYVSIENKHFDGAIHLHISVPEEILELACINIILQPFVENSIMHGIAEDINIQTCNISISAAKAGGDVYFTIQDDGKGMTQAQIEHLFTTGTGTSNNGYGVKNVDSRIKLCYGEKYGLSYESQPGKGTSVKIHIPALTVADAKRMIAD